MSTKAAAVKRALGLAPGSLRALAREAGVSHALLLMVCRGQRGATRPVMAKVAAALTRWAANCERGATALRRASAQQEDR